MAPVAGTVVLIDGMNVIGSRADGWWRDRTGAMRRLAAEVDAWAHHVPGRVLLVLDGRSRDIGVVDDVEVVWAPGGRDAADDRIVDLVASLDDPTTAVVVTSDRRLADRVRGLGGAVHGARTLLDELTDSA